MKIIFYDINSLHSNVNVDIVVHKMVRTKVVYKICVNESECQHESSGFYINIIKNNNGKYQIYYPCKMEDKGQVTSYTEGYNINNLIRPQINQYYPDMIPNNFIMSNKYGCHNFSVFFDANGDYCAIGGIHDKCNKTAEYAKEIDNFYYGGNNINNVVAQSLIDNKYVHMKTSDYSCDLCSNGLYLFRSVNGIEWNRIYNYPIINSFAQLGNDVKPGTATFDTYNKIIYNPYSNKYIIYMRGNVSLSIRHIYYSISNDLINWSDIYPININPEFNYDHDNYYASGAYMYPDANIYIAFPTYFKTNVLYRKAICGNMSLMFSIDGINWKVLDKYFERDTEINSDFDIKYRYDIAGFMLSECNTLFDIFINEHSRTLNSQLTKYTIRRDGFTSLYSDNGTCSIKIKLQNINKIIINYKSINDGYIIIKLYNNDNIMYLSEKLTGDYINFEIFFQKIIINCNNISFEIYKSYLYSVNLL
jgi:hypothetical protein